MFFRISKIRIPTFVIKLARYLIEWAYKVVFSHFGICQPQMLTPARIRYVTLNRTFSCNKAVEELGYKPIVTLMVHSFNSLGVVFMILFSVSATPFFIEMLMHFSNLLSRMV